MTTGDESLPADAFLVTGSDGGPTPLTSLFYEVTADVPIGQMHQSEFVADEESDWAFHCHKSHHTMNAMSHDVANLIGVDHGEVARKITNLIPDYMVMGERGMADMAAMEMPIPDNTGPMMTGDDPYGSVEMGGMFSVVKVQRNQRPGDYSDPGWYQHPPGTLAYEFTGTPGKPARLQSEMRPVMPRLQKPPTEVEVTVRKPNKTHH